MNTITFLFLALPVTLLPLAGCARRSTEQPKPAKETGATAPANSSGQETDAAAAQANLEKLTPEDRRLAGEQGFCAVDTKNPLGSMGVPVKVAVQDQPVFLCCDACRTKALAHADRTLAKVKELKARKADTLQK